MFKIGRYGIAFGRTLWLQTKAPTRIWHFLWFWFLKEARPHDVDREKLPIDTLMEQEGRKYRYWKAAKEIE